VEAAWAQLYAEAKQKHYRKTKNIVNSLMPVS